jgi:hypothetical protein
MTRSKIALPSVRASVRICLTQAINSRKTLPLGAARLMSEDSEVLRRFLADALPGCLETGHFQFWDPFTRRERHSEQRIRVEAMAQLREGWARLLLEDVRQFPTGGLVEVHHGREETNFTATVEAAAEAAGWELPVSGVRPSGIELNGRPLSDFPPGAAVTIWNSVTTLGTDLKVARRSIEEQGLRVGRLVSLVHRAPELPADLDGIPYTALVHFPLPLHQPLDCPGCLLGRRLHPLVA